MTKENARAVSNAILVAAGLAAAYGVLRTPPLRRLAYRAVRLWLATGGVRSLLT
jgi:hypothetical protein